jgi:predicted lipid-binding transport protein (Tim44 family)
MDVDGETVVAWLRTWGAEAVLGGLAVVGLVAGVQGSLLALLLGTALAVATVDRVRLRLDNRSLAEAVEEASEVRVSAARRETPADEATTTERAEEPTAAGDADR